MSDQTNADAIRLVVVDDDPFVCDSLRTILDAQPDLTVLATGHDAASAVDLWQEHRPDILLTDIRMAGGSGLDAAATILQEDPQARIVLLTTFADDEYIVSALSLGVRGYLIKQDVATIAPSLRLVMAGQSVLGSEVLGRVDQLLNTRTDRRDTPVGADQAGGVPTRLAATPRTPRTPGQTPRPAASAKAPPQVNPALSTLTEREQEVVELVARGLDNRDIAQALFISEGTVRNLVSLVLQKTGLKNRTQLAVAHYRP
ncbi:MAG: response regulator transcription factor [Propionibacteriaceae bacterium]|jgi:DNA-binding NarL/FixJ family response regulator|nr:response regulator transcription factor [Propionibacteriaceae bacterium]